MDYEKLYKEARDRSTKVIMKCRPLSTEANLAVHHALSYVFPATTESEDERIIMELKDFVRLNCGPGQDEYKRVEEWCYWLGKQKEQKPLDISAASEWLKKHICNYVNSEYNEFHKCVEYDGSINKERLISDFEEAMQKEQKPAEWSEEDKQMINLLIAIFEVNYPNGFYKANPINTTNMSGVHSSEIISWLRSLRPQLKREDWTGEDSLAIREIQNALQIDMINYGISEERRKKLARWLDIHCNAYPLPAKIYPHWKPSEKQMSALKHFIGPSVNGAIVAELYDDLKNYFSL